MDAYIQRAIRSNVSVSLTDGRPVGFDSYVAELAIYHVTLKRMSAKQRPGCVKDQCRLLLAGKNHQVKQPVVVIGVPADSKPHCVPRDVPDKCHSEVVKNLLAVGDYVQARVIVLQNVRQIGQK